MFYGAQEYEAVLRNTLKKFDLLDLLFFYRSRFFEAIELIHSHMNPAKYFPDLQNCNESLHVSY